MDSFIEEEDDLIYYHPNLIPIPDELLLDFQRPKLETVITVQYNSQASVYTTAGTRQRKLKYIPFATITTEGPSNVCN
jgi:hypothetical protein